MDHHTGKRKEMVKDRNPDSTSKRVCSGVGETHKGKEIVMVGQENHDLQVVVYEDSPLFRPTLEKEKFWELLRKVSLSDLTGDEANDTDMGQAMVVESSSSTTSKYGGGRKKAFAALYFMCAVTNTMYALMHYQDQGVEASFSLLDIMEMFINLNHGDQHIFGSTNEPFPYPLEVALRGALTVMSVKPAGRLKGPWGPFTFRGPSGHWKWVGPELNPTDPQLDIMDVNNAHLVWGVTKSIVKCFVLAFKDWLEIEERHVAALAAVHAGSIDVPVHNLMGFLARLRVERPWKKFRVPEVSIPAVRARFREEERLRYTVHNRAFFYTALDGERTTVSPLFTTKKMPLERQSKQLRLDCPMGVTIHSVVRDSAARLPDGVGTTRDVSALVRDSQYLTVSGMDDASLQLMVSSALNRLEEVKDPCVVFDKVYGKTGRWTYLHRNRGLDEFREDGRHAVPDPNKRHRRSKKLYLELNP